MLPQVDDDLDAGWVMVDMPAGAADDMAESRQAVLNAAFSSTALACSSA